MIEKRVLVCATNRSGSNYFGELLRSTGCFGYVHELLYKPDFFAYLKTLKRNFPFDQPFTTWPPSDISFIWQNLLSWRQKDGIWACKILLPHLEFFQYIMEVESLTWDDFKVIYLYRRDKLKQAISAEKAERLNEWCIRNEEADKVKINVDREKELKLDLDAIKRHLERFSIQESSWQYFFSVYNVDPHVVCYEDFANDDVNRLNIIKGCLDFLGVHPKNKLTVKTNLIRQYTDLNQEVFDEICCRSLLKLGVRDIQSNVETRLSE